MIFVLQPEASSFTLSSLLLNANPTPASLSRRPPADHPAESAGAASGLAIAVRHDGCYAVSLASRPFLASAVPVEVVSDGVVRRPGAGLAISSTRAFNSSDRVGAFEAFAIEWTGSGVDLTTTFKRHTTTPRAAELGTSRATS